MPRQHVIAMLPQPLVHRVYSAPAGWPESAAEATPVATSSIEVTMTINMAVSPNDTTCPGMVADLCVSAASIL